MMVHRYGCEICETRVDYLARDGDLYCSCGEKLSFEGTVGCVTGVGDSDTNNESGDSV